MMKNDKRRHIVIVDDDPVNLDLAENALAGQYKLSKLISGEQLFRFLQRVRPDMILLDVQMPGINGYQVLEQLNENAEIRKIPVIFLTGLDSVDSEREGFRLGAKDFIRKPFDNEVMLARIHSQMELYIYRSRLEILIDEKTNQIEELQHALTISLAEMIESRDGTTGSHVRNTTSYYSILIQSMQSYPAYSEELCNDIFMDLLRASTLHDIGKIGISDAILKKPGPLDKEEFEEMQQHSIIGAQMIDKLISQSHFGNFLYYARDMARHHHERWDGTGYPDGLKGTEIPVSVRALSIVDVYDALTSVRPYKGAFSHEQAIDMIRHDSGKFFDPAIFDIFLTNADAIQCISGGGGLATEL